MIHELEELSFMFLINFFSDTKALEVDEELLGLVFAVFFSFIIEIVCLSSDSKFPQANEESSQQ
jgi:hypothetical protein